MDIGQPLWGDTYRAAFRWARKNRPEWTEQQQRDFAVAAADMLRGSVNGVPQ